MFRRCRFDVSGDSRLKTFLNLPAYSPHMTLAVCRLLESMGGRGTEDEVRAWLAPDGLYRNADGSGTAPRDDWGYTYALEVAEHLGFIAHNADSYK